MGYGVIVFRKRYTFSDTFSAKKTVMANFRFRHIEEINKNIKTKEVSFVPCNHEGTIIGEGSAAIVFLF